jgi:hypothetical protein
VATPYKRPSSRGTSQHEATGAGLDAPGSRTVPRTAGRDDDQSTRRTQPWVSAARPRWMSTRV